LNRDEVAEMTILLRAHRRAEELDLPDMVDFMLGTGVRLGEAPAVSEGINADGEALLDLTATRWRSTPPSCVSRAVA